MSRTNRAGLASQGGGAWAGEIEAARAWGQLGDCLEKRTLVGRLAATLRRPAGW